MQAVRVDVERKDGAPGTVWPGDAALGTAAQVRRVRGLVIAGEESYDGQPVALDHRTPVLEHAAGCWRRRAYVLAPDERVTWTRAEAGANSES